jgi:hypothetical protein
MSTVPGEYMICLFAFYWDLGTFNHILSRSGRLHISISISTYFMDTLILSISLLYLQPKKYYPIIFSRLLHGFL